MSEIHEIVKKQFDKQALNFSNWSVTKNIEYQKAYFDFCEISEQDNLLDFACGTGEFAIFAAPKRSQPGPSGQLQEQSPPAS